MAITEINNEEQYTEILSGNVYVVVLFGAAWCGPCKAVKPEYIRLSSRFLNVMFCHVDIDCNDMNDVVQRVGVKKVPTFVVYDQTHETFRMEGINIASLEDKLCKLW